MANFKEALNNVDGVVVATDTSLHIKVAIEAAKRNIAIFFEKPISSSLIDIKPFIHEMINNDLIIEIGFQLRTHPNLIKLAQLTKEEKFGPLYSYRAVVGQRLVALPVHETISSDVQLPGIRRQLRSTPLHRSTFPLNALPIQCFCRRAARSPRPKWSFETKQ